MPLTLARLALLNAGVFALDLTWEYAYQKNHFYAILAAMFRSARFKALAAVQVVLITYLIYRLVTWLLFGRLTRTERDYLRDIRWPVFLELSNTFLLFQTAVSSNLWSFVHFIFMYYLLLSTKLLEKRIEETAGAAPPDQQDLQQEEPRPGHWRLPLIIAALYLANWHGLKCQMGELHHPKTGKLSLVALVTVHRYVISSAHLAKCILTYALELIEARYYAGEWAYKSLWQLAVDTQLHAITVASYGGVMWSLASQQIRALSLLRMTIRAVKRFVTLAQELVAALRAIRRLTAYPLPSEDEVVRAHTTCAICLESMRRGPNELGPLDHLRRLPDCAHVFHLHCLTRWASSRPVCPSCRTAL